MSERILITGLGGAVGTELGTVLPGAAGDADLVVVFSSEKSRDRFLAGADAVLRAILQTEVCDLRDAAAVAAMGARLHRVERTVVVHAAANTSWTLPLETACRFNVDATRNVAELARRTSAQARMIYVSSAFTATDNWVYRNTYEESKAAAERMLRADYPDLRTSVFACSLVVGHSVTGRIARFHGVYPLLRLIENYSVPVVPGERGHKMDIVPVDWVADELLRLLADVRAGGGPRDVIAAAGEAAPSMTELVEHVAGALNLRRLRDGRPSLPQIAVLGMRQWEFLRRSLDSWDVDTNLPDPRLLDRIMATYRPYLAAGHVRPPAGTFRPTPSYLSYIDPVVSFWLDSAKRGERVLTAA
jgi:nucleoside-diphosphate-sugar epimerase